MIYLILAIICSVSIANFLHLFSLKKTNILIVFLGNYFVAAAFSAAVNHSSNFSFNYTDIGFGIFVGFMFLFNFTIYQKNIVKNGISLSSGAMRFSLVIPTIISILFFKETIFPMQTVGIAVVLLSFVFLTKGESLHSILWLMLLFFLTGINDTIIRTYKEYGKHESLFIMCLFSTALIANLFWIFRKKIKFDKKSFLCGLALGIPNALVTTFFLKSLDTLKAAVAYPVFSAGIMVLCILSEIIIWKNKYTKLQKSSLIVMVFGIILINLKL